MAIETFTRIELITANIEGGQTSISQGFGLQDDSGRIYRTSELDVTYSGSVVEMLKARRREQISDSDQIEKDKEKKGQKDE
jgi:hypothetical protein